MMLKQGFFLSALMLFFAPAVYAADTRIRITNGEWEPYLSEYAYQYGLASHIVSEAFRLEGIAVEWGFFPWKRAYEIVKIGQWDASAVWWPTEETKEYFWVSEPVVVTSFVYFHLKSNPFHWEQIEDLKDLKIGTTLGYDYGKEFMTAAQQGVIKIDASPKDELNYKKLLLGRIDIFPNDPLVGYAQIKNSFTPEDAQRFTHHPREFEKSTLNLIISKHTPDGRFYLEKFNAGLQKLQQSGRLEQMFEDMHNSKYDKRKTKWGQQ
jgi:polar amino acid transport system substrate-binding protein